MPQIIQLPKCSLCDKDYVNGDQVSGVRLGAKRNPKWVNTKGPTDEPEFSDPGKYVEGHYECVLKALKAEEQLEALHAGQMPPQNVIDAHRVAIQMRLNETPQSRAQEIQQAPKAV
jgi:hypothetical protein